jgi:alanine racemase
MFDYSDSLRATRALIHLDNLRYNLDRIRELIGPSRKICLAVKADAYGHGAVAVSRAALARGVSALAVSNVDEGRELREAGIEAPVILMGYPAEAEMPALLEQRLEPFVGDQEFLNRIDSMVRDRGDDALGIHIAVDTGMGRIGCPPEDAPALARLADSCEGVRIAGLCTHFPVSDSELADDRDFTEQQILSLSQIRKEILSMNIDPGLVHAANSGGILQHDPSHLDMVRLGISAYGYVPDSWMNRDYRLKPVMELKTKISFLKTVPAGMSISYGRTWSSDRSTVIATLPVGYADGYSRLLSGKAEVLYKGKRYAVAGRICMDQLMVDLGPDADARIGDEVVLFGPDPAGPDAGELAHMIGTIPYEISCAINKRVPRSNID